MVAEVLPLVLTSNFPAIKFFPEWKNSLYIIGFSFVSNVHENLHCENIQESSKEAISLITAGDLKSILPSDVCLAETMYYIAGWLLSVIGNESDRRKDTIVSNILDNIFITCNIDRESADSCALLCGKVNRVMAYGGLKYPSASFYHFVAKIEKCFGTIITSENLLLHGPSLNNLIMLSLRNNLRLEILFAHLLEK